MSDCITHTGESAEVGPLDSECFEHEDPPNLGDLQERADELKDHAMHMPREVREFCVEVAEILRELARSR